MATKRELLRMVSQFCSECMGGPRATEDIWSIGNPRDVADCTAPECVWFKYRFEKDPDKPVSSEAQQQADKERSLRLKE